MEIKELQVLTPAINFNEAEVKAYLADLMTKYENLVFSEDSVSDCKKTVTELNKMIKDIDEFRLRNKKIMEAPIKEFEAKCKSLIKLIEETQEPIKLQSEKFEQQRRDEKRKLVEGIIAETIQNSGLEDRYSSRIQLKEEYLNVSMTANKIRQGIVNDLVSLKAEQEAYYNKKDLIDTKCELYSAKLGLEVALIPDNFYHMIELYDRDAIDGKIFAIAEKTKANELATLEALKRKMEKEAEQKAQVQVEAVVEQMGTVMAAVDAYIPVEPVENEPTYDRVIKITGTKKQLNALKAYLDGNGFTYESIKEA